VARQHLIQAIDDFILIFVEPRARAIQNEDHKLLAELNRKIDAALDRRNRAAFADRWDEITDHLSDLPPFPRELPPKEIVP